MNSAREPLLPILITAVIALVLTIMPLPSWLALLRPAFLVLAVLYWSIMTPFAAGMALAFLCGLTLDVFQNSLLGEHALALSLVCYLAIRFHLLVRAKPVFEQSLFIFAALLIYELVLWLIDGWLGLSVGGIARWLPTAIGALLWPLIVGFMGRLHSPR